MNPFGGVGTHEYILQGSIVDSAVETLIQRIRGLADPSVSAFLEHEMMLALKTPNSTVAQLHCRFDQLSNSDPSNMVCQLKYVGSPEPDEAQVSAGGGGGAGAKTPFPVLCRKVVETLAKSNDIMNFLREMGFRYQHSFIAEGKLFTKGHVKITLSKISRVDKPSDTSTAQKLTNSHLVEMSAVAPPGDVALAKSMRDLADQLKPLVRLEKVDYMHMANQHFLLGGGAPAEASAAK